VCIAGAVRIERHGGLDESVATRVRYDGVAVAMQISERVSRRAGSAETMAISRAVVPAVLGVQDEPPGRLTGRGDREQYVGALSEQPGARAEAWIVMHLDAAAGVFERDSMAAPTSQQ
jgi:hypothetical protein